MCGTFLCFCLNLPNRYHVCLVFCGDYDKYPLGYPARSRLRLLRIFPIAMIVNSTIHCDGTAYAMTGRGMITGSLIRAGDLHAGNLTGSRNRFSVGYPSFLKVQIGKLTQEIATEEENCNIHAVESWILFQISAGPAWGKAPSVSQGYRGGRLKEQTADGVELCPPPLHVVRPAPPYTLLPPHAPAPYGFPGGSPPFIRGTCP